MREALEVVVGGLLVLCFLAGFALLFRPADFRSARRQRPSKKSRKGR